MFVVIVDKAIAYVGSWRGANGFGKLCVLVGDRPLVRRACTGEVAAYRSAPRSNGSLPTAAA
jgi:hypothetical protein